MIGDREITAHTWTAQLVGANGIDLGPVRYVSEGRFTLDESWSPYGQGSLTFSTADAPDFVQLDPDEDSPEVFFVMTQSYGDVTMVGDFSGRTAGYSAGDLSAQFATPADLTAAFGWAGYDGAEHAQREVSRRGYLMVRSREVNLVDETVTLGIATIDAKLADHAHVSAGVPELLPPEGMTRVYDLVNWVLTFVVGTPSLNLTDGTAESATFVREANPWRTGQTAWDYLAPLLQTVDLRLWADLFGQWTLRSAQETPAQEARFSGAYSLVSASDLIDVDSTVTRSVLVTYEWDQQVPHTGAEPETVRMTRYDAAQIGGSSRNPFVVTYNRPYPGPGAAARILAQRSRRRRSVPIGAVSDYRVVPGMKVTTAAGAGFVRGVVRSVEWDARSDEMTIATRDVEALPEN